jgi:hypothetical protein
MDNHRSRTRKTFITKLGTDLLKDIDVKMLCGHEPWEMDFHHFFMISNYS